MKKYAFFLDMDGTFLATGGKLIPENIKACNEAIEKGHYIFICSGRPMPNIQKELLSAVNWSGYVTSLGAVVELDGSVKREIFMSEECADKIAEIFFKTDKWLCISNNDRATWINWKEKRENGDIVTSFEEFKKLNRRYSKFTSQTGFPDELLDVISKELHLFVYEEDEYAEAVADGVSKASGIECVINELGIPRENTVAVGDSANDLDMIKYAGIGVAMDNAPDEVKKEADIITDTNNNCGVAKIIREITG